MSDTPNHESEARSQLSLAMITYEDGINGSPDDGDDGAAKDDPVSVVALNHVSGTPWSFSKKYDSFRSERHNPGS